jgi:hypothetical protein
LRSRQGRHRRGLLIVAAAAALVVVVAAPLSSARAAGPDDVVRVIEALRNGRTFKVRIQAASALARFSDRRVVAELGRAADVDRNPNVRIYALRLLGKSPGGEPDDANARAAIKRALDDRRPDVRAQAQRSLADLDRRRAERQATTPPPRPSGDVIVSVRGVGDKTGRASAAVKAALRASLLMNLRQTRGVRAVEGEQPGTSYIIDASIARYQQTNAGTDLELTVGIELVISRPPRGIVLIATGEASIIEPRASLRGNRRASMESDAVHHAALSAHENLAKLLASSR